MRVWVNGIEQGGEEDASAIRLSGDISPTAITGSNDNYAPTGLSTASTIRQDLSAAATLTGLTGGSDGRVIFLYNIATTAGRTLTFTHDATSTAANRFLCPGGVAYVVPPTGGVVLQYDSTSSRWRVSHALAPAGTNGGVMAYGANVWATTAAGTSGMSLLSAGSAAATWNYPNTIGDGTGQVVYQGGARVARTAYAAHGTYTQLVTDHVIGVTDTSGAVTIQLVASSSSATSVAEIIVKDESYAAGTNNITISPPSGKKLDNVTDNATVKIATNGGRWAGYEDASGNWHTIGIS